jgi:hypothetical protein
MIDYSVALKPKSAVLLDPAPLLKTFEKFSDKLELISKQADDQQVTDDASNAKCAEMNLQLKQLKNEIEGTRKTVLAPYLSLTSTVNERCKMIKAEIDLIRKGLEDKNIEYMLEMERIRKEAEQDLIEKAQSNQAAGIVEVLPDVPPKTAVQTIAGTQDIKYKTTATLIDPTKLSKDCIAARFAHIEKAVLPWANAQIKAGIRTLPGLAIKQEPVMKTRAAKYNTDKF